MDPFTMMMLAQLVPAGINLVKSGVQGYKANQLAKTQRPQYQIPDSVRGATNTARYLANMNELPGQNIMEEKLGRTTSNAIADLKNVSSNPSQLGANVAKLYANQLGNVNQLGIQAAQNQQANQRNLMNQLNLMGGYEDKQWNFNQFQPYQDKMAASSALREGAYRNLMSAGRDIASAGAGYGNYLNQQQMLDQLKGNSNAGGFASTVTPTNRTGNFNIGVKPSAIVANNLGNGQNWTPVDPNAVDDILNYGSNYKDRPYNPDMDFSLPVTPTPPLTPQSNIPDYLFDPFLYRRENKYTYPLQ